MAALPTEGSTGGGCLLEPLVIAPRNGSQHQVTLVYLHPFGSGFEGYTADAYATDYVRLVLPHAAYRPITCYGGELKAAWYDYLTDNGGEAEDVVAEGTLAETRLQIFSLLDSERALLAEREPEAEGFCRRLLIGGCSQGCGAALDAALRYPVHLGGFVGVVGHCLSCTPLGKHRGMPLHFFRKADDQVMQWSWVEGTLTRLRAAGHTALHVHDPAPGGHPPTSAQEVRWIREALWHIHCHYEPPGERKLLEDPFLRQFFELLHRPREAADVRELLATVERASGRLQARHVAVPWAGRLAPRVPLVCAVVEGVTSPQEADALRLFVEGQRHNCWQFSTSHFKSAVNDRWGLTDLLWSRIKGLVPAEFKGKHAAGFNDHLRFKRFGPGHHFKPHEDSSSTQSFGEGAYNTSYLSAILYLSEPGDASRGGRTRLVAPDCPTFATTGRCEDAACSACVDAPVSKGSMVLFSHSLMNADTEVKYGEEKFIMRTDVMYGTR